MIISCILAIEDESDREFMERLFYQYERLLLNEIRKLIRNPEDVEDILQTTLEKLIIHIQILRTRERNALVNYLISTAKNTAYSFLRKKTKEKTFLFEDNDSFSAMEDHNTIEQTIFTTLDLEALAKKWDQLDEKSQLLLEGRYILNKTCAELAEDFGVKETSIRMMLTRARNRAYKLLKDDILTRA